MKAAMGNFLNHPPDGSAVGDPITVASFKKGACDKPTAQGVNCTFTMTVKSANPFAQMFNNLPSAVFYKDANSGNWMMRAPFWIGMRPSPRHGLARSQKQIAVKGKQRDAMDRLLPAMKGKPVQCGRNRGTFERPEIIGFSGK